MSEKKRVAKKNLGRKNYDEIEQNKFIKKTNKASDLKRSKRCYEDIDSDVFFVRTGK